jgi:hypothetical protein
MFQLEFLRKAVDLGLDQADALACAVAVAANRDDPQVFRARRIDHRRRAVMIGRDHGSPIGYNEITEQP